jgi:hypothetical protein
MGAETGGSILCQLLLCVQTGEPFTIDPKRWFLDGFCPFVQPKLSLLLTAGDVMESRRLNKLWHAYNKSTPVVFEYQMSVSRRWMMQIKDCISNCSNRTVRLVRVVSVRVPMLRRIPSQVNGFSAYSTFRTKERGELLEEPDGRWVAKRGQWLKNFAPPYQHHFVMLERV